VEGAGIIVGGWRAGPTSHLGTVVLGAASLGILSVPAGFSVPVKRDSQTSRPWWWPRSVEAGRGHHTRSAEAALASPLSNLSTGSRILISVQLPLPISCNARLVY
jgi:hypothetical protein